MFLGERLHTFNASAQYAAPLMADFGAEIHNKTSIRYIDTGTQLWRFTFWINVTRIASKTVERILVDAAVNKLTSREEREE